MDLLKLGCIAALLLGCTVDDNSALFADEQELRQQANALLEQVRPVGGTLVDGPLPSAGLTPLLAAHLQSRTWAAGQRHQLTLVFARAEAPPTEVLLGYDRGERHWSVPLQVADGQATVELDISPADRPYQAELGVIPARDGVLGQQILVPLDIQPTPQRQVELRVFHRASPITLSLAFGSLGTRPLLATGGLDGSVELWDLDQTQRFGALPGHTGAVTALAYGAARHRLYSGSRDHTIRVWDLDEQSLLTVYGEHLGEVHGLAVSPDLTRLAGVDWDGRLIIRDAESGVVQEDHDVGLGLNDVAWSPQSDRVAVAGGRVVQNGRVVVFRGGSVEREYDLPGPATALAFSPDGARLAAGFGRSSIGVWSTADGSEVAVLNPPCVAGTSACLAQPQRLGTNLVPASRDVMTDLAFAPLRNDQVVTGSMDGIIGLWDLPTGRMLGGTDIRSPVLTLALSASLDLLAAGDVSTRVVTARIVDTEADEEEDQGP